MIQIQNINAGNGAGGTGLSVQWDGGQFVMIQTQKGLVSCGILDPTIIEKFGFAVAIARGTPECPLVHPDDLRSANISYVSPKAEEYGVRIGMTGEEALCKLA